MLQDRVAWRASTTILEALEYCDDEVKALNLGALLLMCEDRKPRVERILSAAKNNYLSLKYFTNDREMRQAFWDDISNWEDPKFTNNRGTLLQLAVKYNVERPIKFLLRQQFRGLNPDGTARDGYEPRDKLYKNRPSGKTDSQ